MTHILTVTLTDDECHALQDLLSAVSPLKNDPLGATAGRSARLSASREVLHKLQDALGHPGRLLI